MFNNGFNNYYPYQTVGYKQGLFSNLKGKFNWSSLLNNTQKTLNIINQAIPVFYQIKPIWNNTKTVFKILGAIKSDNNTPDSVNTSSGDHKHRPSTSASTISNNNDNSYNSPSFFL